MTVWQCLQGLLGKLDGIVVWASSSIDGTLDAYYRSDKHWLRVSMAMCAHTSTLRSIALPELEGLHLFVKSPSVILVIEGPLRWYIGDFLLPFRCEDPSWGAGSSICIAHLRPDLGKLEDEA